MRNFLFIDFGASRVKAITYDIQEDQFGKTISIESPFLMNVAMAKTKTTTILKELLSLFPQIDAVIPCCILGGGYENDVYYSWKSKKDIFTASCLISELFKGGADYHVHRDHGGTVSTISFLGKLNNVSFYSCLGDTPCVARSIKLDDMTCILNLGTGSQIISKKEIISFIPSGRALNVFKFFFDSVDVDLFDEFSKLTYEDLLHSSLDFNLNIFKEAYEYGENSGSIRNIQEDTFNLRNFICSLFRSYLEQYLKNLHTYNIIYLTGGISRRYPLIQEFFEKYGQKEIILRSTEIEDTFIGMRNRLLKDYGNINNRS